MLIVMSLNKQPLIPKPEIRNNLEFIVYFDLPKYLAGE